MQRPRIQFHTVVGLILAILSCFVALLTALYAPWMTTVEHINPDTIYNKDGLFIGYLAPGSTSSSPTCLFASGITLFLISAVHIFPLSLATTRKQLLIFLATATILPVTFGLLFYFAELHDPFPMQYADHPFLLASFFCVFPFLRAGVRSFGLSA